MTPKRNYQIDGERALVSMGGPCKYGCTYCYTYEQGFNGFPKSTPEEILPTLRDLSGGVKLLQCGYDNEFFEREGDALRLIRGMADLGFDVSFATKKDLSEPTIAQLRDVMDSMQSGQPPNYLVACVSILGFDTVRRLEPRAPDPELRVQTIHRLYAMGIPTLVYARPLFPAIPTAEIEELFERTEGHCNGYVLGPTIADDKNAELLGIPRSEKKQQKWSFDEREWFEFVDPRIAELTQRPDVFFRSKDAMAVLMKSSIEELVGD